MASSPWSDPTNHCSDGNGLHQAEGSRGGCHRAPALFSMLISSCARASRAPESNPLQSTTHDLPTDGYMESMMHPVPVRCKHNREVAGWWCRASQPSPQVEHIRAHTTGSSSSIHRWLRHRDHSSTKPGGSATMRLRLQIHERRSDSELAATPWQRVKNSDSELNPIFH